MKYTLYALLVLLATACSRPKEETVKLDELAPVSERYKEGKESANQEIPEIKDERPEKSNLLPVIGTLFESVYWHKWDTLLFADRFGPKTAEKWQIVSPSDSLIVLQYTFKDSLRTKNAFFNWIDCFGQGCKSYKIGGNLRLKGRAGLILVGATNLVFFESNKSLDEQKIRAALESDPEKENWLYLVRIPRNGKTIWKKITKGKESQINQVNENS